MTPYPRNRLESTDITSLHGRLVAVETQLHYVVKAVEKFDEKLETLVALSEQEKGRTKLIRAMIPLGSAMIGAGSMVLARMARWIP